MNSMAITRSDSRGAPPSLTRLELAPFATGTPALDAFPNSTWAQLIMRHAYDGPGFSKRDIGTAGVPELRQTIADYLCNARGVTCRAEQVFITTGYRGALGLLARALLRQGDRIWIEDPGYYRARDALAHTGADLVRVPVDSDGLDPLAGLAEAEDGRFALVTPTHQAPLCVTLSAERRAILLDWASRGDAWILEDDYDSEFSYASEAPPALKSLDEDDRVILFGTFSKSLLPSLLLGYVVVPPSLVERFARIAALYQPAPDPMMQRVLRTFIEEGHFAHHLKSMRHLYAKRREAVAVAMKNMLGGRMHAELARGGLHIVAYWQGEEDDAELFRRARVGGLAPLPLSRFSAGGKHPPALLLGFANTPVERAEEDVARLKAALEGAAT
jgi:GntR family transcriptional regulator/MocR family aminotransferase